MEVLLLGWHLETCYLLLSQHFVIINSLDKIRFYCHMKYKQYMSWIPKWHEGDQIFTTHFLTSSPIALINHFLLNSVSLLISPLEKKR